MSKLAVALCAVLVSLYSLAAHAQTPPSPSAIQLIEQGHAAATAGNLAEARGIFAQVLALPDAPAYCKSLGLLATAASFERENLLAEAKQTYSEITKLPGVPAHHVWEAEQALKAIGRVEAGLPPRDPADSRVKLPAPATPGLTWFVALDGKTGNPGTLELPFANLRDAIDALRALKAGAGLPPGGLRICLRAGVYRMTETLQLDDAVSGRADAPVIISSYEGESARLSGGATITGFQTVQDPAILARLPEEGRGKVMVTDLKAQGITHSGSMSYRGFGCGSKPSIELFFNGTPMTPARWPNEGFVRTGKVLEAGAPNDQRGGVFEYEGDRPSRWLEAPDIWLYGYWFYDWADNTIGLTSIDTATHQFRTAHASNYGIKEGQPYYVFNLLEEIDAPGEWYLDRGNGLLYLYPPADPASATIEISLLKEPLINLQGVSYMTLQGLTVELGAGNGIVGTDCNHCLVAGCVVRRLGATGVTFQGGANDGILSCEIYSLGRGGTVIVGGDRKTLTPGGHFVENCEIHHFSRIDRTYTPAVQIEGVGNRIAHNNFHDTPCHAIRLEGNDHVVEFNDVHDVVQESDDQGGIDMFYNLTYRGNQLRYNYWHDIRSGRACGQAGIRLDDAISGTAIYGNVFSRCSESLFGGVQIHGGKDNWVDNNIFADCKYAVSFSPWRQERWSKFLASEAVVKMLTVDVNATEPPYSTRYPDLLRLNEGVDANTISRNIVYNCGALFARDKGMHLVVDNLVTQEDPGFADAANRNFALNNGAPVLDSIGFRPIPFGEIGQYEDAYRAALKSQKQ